MEENSFVGRSYQDEQQLISSAQLTEEGVVTTQDPLALDIKDEELVKIIDDRIDASKKFFDQKYNLTERRNKNELYLFGRQLDNKEKKNELKLYEARHLHNVLYEIESSLKPLAMSHLPDMLVLPGSEEPQKQKTAKDLSMAINDTNKKRRQRQVLALGFKHLPVYFSGVIKVRWNSEEDDFCFENPHPSMIVVDHTAKTNNSDDMNFVAQCLPVSVQELYMKYPSKKEEIQEQLKTDGVQISDNPTWKELATEVNVWEVWFDWYKRKDKKDILGTPLPSNFEPGVKWEKFLGVVWKYGKVALDKMLDPNFDHEGEDIIYVYDRPGDETTKRELKPDEMLLRMMSGDMNGISREKIYHNYFKRPHKPFFFFGYDQWGKIPLDETSRIEQNIRNQENLDEQGKRIVDQLKQRIKHIWSKESGLKAQDIQRLDMENPNLDVLVNGDISKVHGVVDPERPDPAQYKSLEDTQSRMYGISGATAVRGQIQSDVATTNQIAREADFTRADDLVEDTINAASEWMADWQMQFIKLRYTEEHLKQIIGKEGSVTFLKLRRDVISDGMEVIIKSSSSDKLRAQNNALKTAQLGAPFTDPISFFQDMGMNDPEGRAAKGLMFANSPQLYMAKYVMGQETTQDMANTLNGNLPQSGQPATPEVSPQTPTAGNTQEIPINPSITPEASPRNVESGMNGMI
jgi:hypothetical protein